MAAQALDRLGSFAELPLEKQGQNPAAALAQSANAKALRLRLGKRSGVG
jgi:hypothetical protein